VRALLERECKGLFDSVTTDPMGNLIATKRSNQSGAQRVLLACHIDEIGFYVRHVDDKGFVRVHAAGMFDTKNLSARRVLIQTSTGDLVGLMNPSGRPIHIAKDEDKKKLPDLNDFAVDLCLPADEVRAKVRVGDPVTIVQEFSEVGHCVTGKCLDNRVAAFIAMEALRKVSNPRFDVTLACTVQEEVGLRGAGPAAFTADPHIAIAVDTTLAVDTPGVPEDERVTKQGDGVALTLMDGSMISDRALVDELESIAKRREIPHQLSILPRGGTDAGPMQRQRGGVRVMTLSVPTRYIHTATESIHQRDIQSAIDLLAAWLEG
jgi:endoglucanase